FAINIALQREGAVVAAVTYNPATNEMFWAEKGKGCFVNDKRLRVAARTRLEESVLATGIPFMGHGQHATFLKELHQVSQRVAGEAGRMRGLSEPSRCAFFLDLCRLSCSCFVHVQRNARSDHRSPRRTAARRPAPVDRHRHGAGARRVQPRPGSAGLERGGL